MDEFMSLLGQKFEYGSVKRELDIVTSGNPKESGFIYIDDVLRAFKIPNADRFEANGRTLSSMRDGKGTMYNPERIPCRPNCIIQVINEATSQSTSALGSTATPLGSVDESVDQLNISNNSPTNLDPFESLRVNLLRQVTVRNQEYIKAITASIITENRAKFSDDYIINEELSAEHIKSMIVPVTTSLGIEKIASLMLGSLSKQDTMTQQNVQDIFDQGIMMQRTARKVLELQKKINDGLILIEEKTKSILNQRLELAECLIPRIFIVLPEEPVKFDPVTWFKTKFRLYFICECSQHTETKESKISHHLHLTKHEGYLVREPAQFFKKYGPFLFITLEMIKVGVNIPGYAVPALSTLTAIKLTDSVEQPVELITAKIEYSLECIDYQLDNISASLTRDTFEAKPHSVSAQQNLANYLSDVRGLDGNELCQLPSFLENPNKDRIFGNLYRVMALDGAVKWICRNHYEALHQKKFSQNLRDKVKVAEGEYDEQLGKITIAPRSSIAADEFYDALGKTKGALEVNLCWNWKCTSSDLEKLEITLRNTRILSLQLKIKQFQARSNDKSPIGQALSRVMEHHCIQMIHIILPNELIQPSTFPSTRPSHRSDLSFHIETFGKINSTNLKILSEAIKANLTINALTLLNGKTGDKGVELLCRGLKNNSTLTALNLRNNCIGNNGAQQLSVILKINSTLAILDLKDNYIGNQGAQALFTALVKNSTLMTLDLRNNICRDIKMQTQSKVVKALKINSTLATLDLRCSSIGDSGAQALFEALKVNSTLTTLNLRSNKINDSGAQALSEALKINSTLTTLNLELNKIDHSGALALSEAASSTQS
ncbi:hypothetical protein FBU30_006676 [Linnemannia zychae]|nr:hypothetical protein FBU30_006676 [Linnemannia zychae]